VKGFKDEKWVKTTKGKRVRDGAAAAVQEGGEEVVQT